MEDALLYNLANLALLSKRCGKQLAGSMDLDCHVQCVVPFCNNVHDDVCADTIKSLCKWIIRIGTINVLLLLDSYSYKSLPFLQSRPGPFA